MYLPALKDTNPELAFIVNVCNGVGSTESTAQLNWDLVLKIAQCHRLVSTLYPLLRAQQHISPTHLEAWHQAVSQNKQHVGLCWLELGRLNSIFKKDSIDFIALKGPLLGYLYYPDPTLRECNDIDILVKEEQVDQTVEVLKTLGYVLTNPIWYTPRQKKAYLENFQHYCFSHSETGLQLELHWRLSADFKLFDLLHLQQTQRFRQIEVGNKHFSYLMPTDNFIYLCVHGSTHRWKRLFWIMDIARIIEREGELFLLDVYPKVKQTPFELSILWGCALAKHHFGTALPSLIQGAIENHKEIPRLVKIAELYITNCHLEGTNPFSRYDFFSLAVRKTFQDQRAVFYLHGLRGNVLSFKRSLLNPLFWQQVSIPDSLFIFNYILAPFLWISAFFKRTMTNDNGI